jgi:hypothetical protein
MSKRPLIFKSVVVIQIGVHPAGEEPNQHVIHMAPQVSPTTTFREVPTKPKSRPCSQGEVLPPSDHSAWPSSWAALFSLQ